MKRIGIVLMMLLTLTAVSAQRGDSSQRGSKQSKGERMSPEERQEKELEQLTKTLSLSAEQILAVTKISDKLNEDIEEKRSSMTEDTDRKVIREEMTVLRTQYNKDVEALLTDDQKVKYKELLSEREEQMTKRQSQGGGGQGGGKSGKGGQGSH